MTLVLSRIFTPRKSLLHKLGERVIDENVHAVLLPGLQKEDTGVLSISMLEIDFAARCKGVIVVTSVLQRSARPLDATRSEAQRVDCTEQERIGFCWTSLRDEHLGE